MKRTNKNKNVIVRKPKRKKLVNIMRRKRFPLMDIWAETDSRGFGHSRGK